jgi:hypothetical protein
MRKLVAGAVLAALLPVATVHAQSSAQPAPAATTVAPAPAEVTAQVPVAPPEPRMGRELNGHLFLPSHIIDDPFSYTAFGMFFGVGAGNALGPTLQREPPYIDVANEKWYGYTGLGLGMLLNVKILEYLSARASFITTAYLGTGSGAIFTIGTSARFTGDVGLKGSLPVGENFRFAATLDASYGPVYALLLAEGISNIIEQCQATPLDCPIDSSGSLQQTDTVTWTAGLSGAWAPTKYLGVVLNTQFIAPTKTGSTSMAQNGFKFAAMADFDALPLVKWLPLGASVAYELTTGVGGNKVPTAQQTGFGFYYTGRKDVALGLEIDWQWATLETQQTSTSTLAWLNLRYYWN